MMQVIQYPHKVDWITILQRPSQDFTSVKNVVQGILDNVKQRGDDAVKEYTKQFDNIELDTLSVGAEEWQTAINIDDDLKAAIQMAIKNVSAFHAAQKQPVEKI